eukprot:1157328-Pyramimonas_sp.AAC.2
MCGRWCTVEHARQTTLYETAGTWSTESVDRCRNTQHKWLLAARKESEAEWEVTVGVGQGSLQEREDLALIGAVHLHLGEHGELGLVPVSGAHVLKQAQDFAVRLLCLMAKLHNEEAPNDDVSSVAHLVAGETKANKRISEHLRQVIHLHEIPDGRACSRLHQATPRQRTKRTQHPSEPSSGDGLFLVDAAHVGISYVSSATFETPAHALTSEGRDVLDHNHLSGVLGEGDILPGVRNRHPSFVRQKSLFWKEFGDARFLEVKV